MRIDLLSIFPAYFAPLELSLMGKAQEAGLLDVHVHDLRTWTEDRHRTVDDTPYGGGAGMVMRADIWGKALDAVIEAGGFAGDAPNHVSDVFVDEAPVSASVSVACEENVAESRRVVLAIPTPSGRPLTQERAAQLTSAQQLIIACGRYEGIDQRVADHYRSRGIAVEEYSIGDYVLNGGEVAALVLVEAVARLLEGVMGNPQSLEEESYSGDGLLEYPTYTKPRSWRDLEVPDVLLGGNHAAIARWRRDRSLERTAHRRPDIVRTLSADALDSRDRECLALNGYLVGECVASLDIRQALPGEDKALSAFASRMFPLACPEDMAEEDIRRFIEENLTVDVCASWIADEEARVLIAESEGKIVGYSLVLMGAPESMPRGNGTIPVDDHAAYLSKCYVAPDYHGTGVAGALLERAVRDAQEAGASQIVLGTNARNARALRFYRKHGFRKSGRRRFQVGAVRAVDEVLIRPL